MHYVAGMVFAFLREMSFEHRYFHSSKAGYQYRRLELLLLRRNGVGRSLHQLMFLLLLSSFVASFDVCTDASALSGFAWLHRSAAPLKSCSPSPPSWLTGKFLTHGVKMHYIQWYLGMQQNIVQAESVKFNARVHIWRPRFGGEKIWGVGLWCIEQKKKTIISIPGSYHTKMASLLPKLSRAQLPHRGCSFQYFHAPVQIQI